MEDVAVTIREKNQAVTLSLVWLSIKSNSLTLELLVCGIEIVHHNREVPNAGIAHLLWNRFAVGRNQFQHRSILRFHKIVAVVGVVDVKT